MASRTSASGFDSATGIRPGPDQCRKIVVGVVFGPRRAGPAPARCAGRPAAAASVEARTSRTRPEGSLPASAASSSSRSAGSSTSGPPLLAIDRVDRQGVGQQPDRPRPHRFVFVPEQSAQERDVGRRRSRTANTRRGSSATGSGRRRRAHAGPPCASCSGSPRVDRSARTRLALRTNHSF